MSCPPAEPPPLPDRSELRLGPVGDIFPGLSRRLGELNMSRANIKIGVTASPLRTLQALGRRCTWNGMKLLWVTRDPCQARGMAESLHAWDRKLYWPEPLEGGARRYYAFVATR